MKEPTREELSQEIIEHLMHPKNYGKLDDATGVGVGHDDVSGEYVIFYVHIDGQLIHKVSFATNGCQDTVVLGSMFTDMIKNQTIDNAIKISKKMREKISHQSATQQVCADMVLTSFVAALTHHEMKLDGSTEEMHAIHVEQSCEVKEEVSSEQ